MRGDYEVVGNILRKTSGSFECKMFTCLKLRLEVSPSRRGEVDDNHGLQSSPAHSIPLLGNAV